MNKSVISIILPAYNAERYLDECIQSVINQTYDSWELIIVNDGSKDSTAKIADKWGMKDGRIRAIHQENGGVSKARNTGISVAQGAFIMFLDSDDLIHPDCLKILSAGMLDVDLCVFPFSKTASDKTDSNQLHGTPRLCFEYKKFQLRQGYIELKRSGLLNPPFCRLFRADIVNSYNIRFHEDMQLAEDLMFNLDYLDHCTDMIIGTVPLYYYRVEFSTLSRSINKYYGRVQSDCYVRHKMFIDTHSIEIDLNPHRMGATSDVVGTLLKAPVSLRERLRILCEFSHTSLAQDYMKFNPSSSIQDRLLKFFLLSISLFNVGA